MLIILNIIAITSSAFLWKLIHLLNVQNFTDVEMTDMHFVSGFANGNSLEESHIHVEMYTQCITPHHRLFACLHERLHEIGTFRKRTYDCGRHCKIRTLVLEAVLNLIDEALEQPSSENKVYYLYTIVI